MYRVISAFLCVFILVICFSGCSAPSVTDVVPSESIPASSAAPEPTVSASVQPTVSDTETEATPESSEEPSLLGEKDGNQYINRALNFQATIPDGWSFATDEEMKSISGSASELVASVTDMKSDSTAMVMMCSQNGFSAGITSNTNINITFSNQASISQLLSSAATMEQLVNQLQSMYTEAYAKIFTNATVTASGEQNIKINDKEYGVIEVDTQYDGGAMYQTQYITPLSEGFLTLTVTYYDDAGKAAVDTFMQNIKYE